MNVHCPHSSLSFSFSLIRTPGLESIPSIEAPERLWTHREIHGYFFVFLHLNSIPGVLARFLAFLERFHYSLDMRERGLIFEQKSFDETRGLNCFVLTSLDKRTRVELLCSKLILAGFISIEFLELLTTLCRAVNCTSANGSSSFTGLISASTACVATRRELKPLPDGGEVVVVFSAEFVWVDNSEKFGVSLRKTWKHIIELSSWNFIFVVDHDIEVDSNLEDLIDRIVLKGQHEKIEDTCLKAFDTLARTSFYTPVVIVSINISSSAIFSPKNEFHGSTREGGLKIPHIRSENPVCMFDGSTYCKDDDSAALVDGGANGFSNTFPSNIALGTLSATILMWLESEELEVS
ncbi:hypothetical protein Tco_1152747 [Tanacetum coccineum]